MSIRDDDLIELSRDDQKHLTAMVYAILDALVDRRVMREEAMAALAHVITAAAIGNEGQLRGWLKPEIVADWISDCEERRGNNAHAH